jgi:transcriptional regulator with GAF, ATPase, and Fis domain
LVKINCTAIPRELFESEFFGHIKGAFSGALRDRVGRFQLADGGTLFLDEIGELPLAMQPKLLRVLQDGEFEPVGNDTTRRVNVRIIAATNRDLKSLVRAGRFREDLYYRLSVFPIEVPPLRDRKDDIPILVQHFLDQYGEESRKPDLILSPEAMDRLLAYNWPGNVRELENVIERAVVLSAERTIGSDLIPDHVSANPTFDVPDVVIPAEGIQFRAVIIGHERRYIEAALEAAGGVQKRAAELLHIKPTTLNEMIKRYEIRPRRHKSPAGARPDEDTDEGVAEPVVEGD